jgi:hypothetical protein
VCGPAQIDIILSVHVPDTPISTMTGDSSMAYAQADTACRLTDSHGRVIHDRFARFARAEDVVLRFIVPMSIMVREGCGSIGGTMAVSPSEGVSVPRANPVRSSA